MLTITLTDRFHRPAGTASTIAGMERRLRRVQRESGGRGFLSVKIEYDRDGVEAETVARKYDATVVSAGEIA